MLRNKSFVKRTRKGNIVRTVKEHYLRDDIICGTSSCVHPVCNASTQPKPLSPSPRDSIKWKRHYVVPDTNAL
ncbi:exosome catalytic subunit dis3, partial [Coemansia sp. RSA 1591]